MDTSIENDNCPEYDTTMIMPALRDPKTNEELLYCCTSASNAREICEACPGGTRLECSDPSHDCFADVTGCPSTVVRAMTTVEASTVGECRC